MNSLKFEALLRRVDLFSLKLFSTVIEEGQIGRAAEKEHIAASAATKRIQDLEELTGMELFTRTAQGVLPTQAGAAFARHVNTILKAVEDLHSEMASLAEGASGSIRIAAPGLLITHLLAWELAEFKRRFPEIEIELHHQNNLDAIQSLLFGDVELAAIVRTPDVNPKGVEWYEWRHDRLVVVVPVGHPFTRRNSITIETLLDENLVGIEPGTTVMISICEAARRIGRKPHFQYHVNTVEAVCSLVEVGLGIAVLPSQILETGDRLTTVELDGEWTRRSYCIGTRAGANPTLPAKKLIMQLAPKACLTVE